MRVTGKPLISIVRPTDLSRRTGYLPSTHQPKYLLDTAYNPEKRLILAAVNRLAKGELRMKNWMFSLALLAASASPALAQTHNREVEIHNRDTVSIYYVYATNAGVDGWGDDWLGTDVIIEDETIRFDFDDGSNACKFDIRVKFADDTVQDLYEVDVCAVSHIDATRSRLVVTN